MFGQFGEGEAPVLHGDRLILNYDHEAGSFITALDKTTGKEIWRANRDEKTSWAAPLVVDFKGKKQIITSATSKVRAYDFDTGRLIWECAGLGRNVIPIEQYGTNLRRLIRRLKQTQAKLIFANTTPVPEYVLGGGRRATGEEYGGRGLEQQRRVAGGVGP